MNTRRRRDRGLSLNIGRLRSPCSLFLRLPVPLAALKRSGKETWKMKQLLESSRRSVSRAPSVARYTRVWFSVRSVYFGFSECSSAESEEENKKVLFSNREEGRKKKVEVNLIDKTKAKGRIIGLNQNNRGAA